MKMENVFRCFYFYLRCLIIIFVFSLKMNAQPPSWLPLYDVKCFVENAIYYKKSIPKNIEDLLNDRSQEMIEYGFQGRDIMYYYDGYSAIRKFLLQNRERISVISNDNQDTEFYWDETHIFTCKNIVDYLGRNAIYAYYTSPSKSMPNQEIVCYGIDYPLVVSFFEDLSCETKAIMHQEGGFYLLYQNKGGRRSPNDWFYSCGKGLHNNNSEGLNAPHPEFMRIFEERCESFCTLIQADSISVYLWHLEEEKK